MPLTILSSAGGSLVVPDETLVLVDRGDGGNLIVNPPRSVWDRGELTAEELSRWSALVAAAGRAMLEELPQLRNGCINYWDAGNWALHDLAEPKGRKVASDHRNVHLHLLGRSPSAKSPSYRWGEAPKFPDYADRHVWAAAHARLTTGECAAIVSRTAALLADVYGVACDAWDTCPSCAYPTPRAAPHGCMAPGKT